MSTLKERWGSGWLNTVAWVFAFLCPITLPIALLILWRGDE
jgi:hypothetical protein